MQGNNHDRHTNMREPRIVSTRGPQRFWQITAIVAIAAAAVFAFLWLSGAGLEKAEEQPPAQVTETPQPSQQAEITGEPEPPESPTPVGTKVPSAEELDITGISIEGMKIIVDAGHGNGVKSGTTSLTGQPEAVGNLKIAEKLKARLEADGATVIMTRENADALAPDYEKDMQAREKIISESGADLFISIHQNETEDPAVDGPQVFFVAQGSPGKRIATAIQDMMNFQLEPATVRMALPAEYRLLKTGIQPSCTVECGFLSNPEEGALLETDEYQQKVADAIADGVKVYAKRFPNAWPVVPAESQ